jgi:hypothetical protein
MGAFIMNSSAFKSELRRVTETEDPQLISRPDPLAPHLADSFAEVLEDPMPIEAAEAVERVAKDIFRPYLENPDNTDKTAAHAFAQFFLTLGFVFKYKPYGVKIASPFGYSIFDLNIGQGFSFQLHLEPKYESFHILHSNPDSFLYLSTAAEWVESGESAASAWAKGAGKFDSPFSCVPEPGDVARIASTEIVHTVVGCTLEEYATTSVDAVERLLDQNNRAIADFPVRHPDVRKLVHDLHPGLPSRLISRLGPGWSSLEMSATEPIIDVPNQLLGTRIMVEEGTAINLPAPQSRVRVIVPTSSDVRCSFADRDWIVKPGQVFTVPPAWEAKLETDQTSVVALHAIEPRLVLREWGAG